MDRYKLKQGRYFVLTVLACCIFLFSTAQKQDTVSYPLSVQFHSVCCGVPNDTPLRSFIKQFRKKNKIKKITAWHIGPMGREGEYWLVFSLKEINNKQILLFKKQVKAIAEKMKDKGNASVEEDITIMKADMPANVVWEKINF